MPERCAKMSCAHLSIHCCHRERELSEEAEAVPQAATMKDVEKVRNDFTEHNTKGEDLLDKEHQQKQSKLANRLAKRRDKSKRTHGKRS